jgi:hypothetical protein
MDKRKHTFGSVPLVLTAAVRNSMTDDGMTTEHTVWWARSSSLCSAIRLWIGSYAQGTKAKRVCRWEDSQSHNLSSDLRHGKRSTRQFRWGSAVFQHLTRGVNYGYKPRDANRGNVLYLHNYASERIFCRLLVDLSRWSSYFWSVHAWERLSDMHVGQICTSKYPYLNCRSIYKTNSSRVESHRWYISCKNDLAVLPLWCRDAISSAKWTYRYKAQLLAERMNLTHTVAATPSLSRTSDPNMNPMASSYPNGTSKPSWTRSRALFPMYLNPTQN